jgi:hypothetical protein
MVIGILPITITTEAVQNLAPHSIPPLTLTLKHDRGEIEPRHPAPAAGLAGVQLA